MATLDEVLGEIGTSLGAFFQNVSSGGMIFFIAIGVVFGVMAMFALIGLLFKKISTT